MNYKFILFSLIGLFIFLFVILNFTQSEGFQNQPIEYLPIQEKALRVLDMFKELVPVIKKGIEEAKPKIQNMNNPELKDTLMAAEILMPLVTDSFNLGRIAILLREKDSTYKETIRDQISQMNRELNKLNSYGTEIISRETSNKAHEILNKISKTVDTTNFDSGLTLYVKSNYLMDNDPVLYTKNSKGEYIPYNYVSKPIETTSTTQLTDKVLEDKINNLQTELNDLLGKKEKLNKPATKLTEKEMEDKINELQSALNKMTGDKAKTTVQMSETGFDAMSVNQKMELLRDIQEMVKNEILNQRFTDSVKPSGRSESDATAQGKEFKNAKKAIISSEKPCPAYENGSCPSMPDMSNYIRKDQIPCWGCSLDY